MLKLGALAAAVLAAVPQPLTEVDVNAYIGRWYQVYASATVKYSFELGGNCVTADYGVTDTDGVISVTNIVRPASLQWIPFLKEITVSGVAAQSPDTAGALTVSLGPIAPKAEDAKFSEPGNYWIIALGPINDDKQYDYAVVSDSTQNTLYVLTRDAKRFATDYDTKVLGMLKDMGFTGALNKPLATNQDNCKYNVA